MRKSIKRTFLLLLLLQGYVLLPQQNALYGQYENVWIFGEGAGLDFNQGNPRGIKSAIRGFGEASASVCDNKGRLLFYTEGTVVWDKHGQVMDNGDNLIPIRSNNDFTATSSSCQGTLIVPEPGSDRRFYVFSLTSLEQGYNAGRLYYSMVDMSLNNGLGGVVASQKGMLLDSGLKEQMTSVIGERCNVWLLVRSTENRFKAFSISNAGIDKTPKLSTIDIGPKGITSTGQLVVSPNRLKMVTAHVNVMSMGVAGSIELYDFDPERGLVNYVTSLNKLDGTYGAAFSPDNSKLYTQTMGSLIQYDLNSPTPATSKIVIGKVHNLSQLKLAPNGKIYVRSLTSDTKLIAVNAPNLRGDSCQFTPDAVQLAEGTKVQLGFPNVISYVTPTTAAPQTLSLSSPCWFNAENGYTLKGDQEGWGHIWDDGSAKTERLIQSPGKYWVTYYTKPCMQHTDTFEFTTPYGVLPTIETDAACRNSATGRAWAYTYPGDTVRYHYTWRNLSNDILSTSDTLDGIPVGSYTLEVRTASCDTLLYIEMTELDERVAFQTDSIVCVGDTIWLQNRSGAYYKDYQWFGNEQAFATSKHAYYTTSSPGNVVIQLLGKGTRCVDTLYRTIIVDARIQPPFVIDKDSICVGQALNIQIPAADPSMLAQYWWINQERRETLQDEPLFSFAFDRPGSYPITLHTDYRACPLYEHLDTVFVEALPVIDLGLDQALCLNGRLLTLGNPNSSNTLRYWWSTGDTTQTIQVKHPGFYQLTAYTPLGCSSTEAVEVKKNCYVDLPNSFSPNGDGTNDYFFPRIPLSEGVVAFHLQVLNRWGQTVFETRSIDGQGWDGQWNNQQQPMDVYIYKLEINLGTRTEQYAGNVTLLR